MVVRKLLAPCLAHSECYGHGPPSFHPGDLSPMTVGQQVYLAPARSPVHAAQSPKFVPRPHSEPSLL